MIGVSVVSPERRLFVSKAFEKIWGRRTDDLYENPRAWASSIHEADRSRVNENFNKLFAGEDYEEEYRIVRPDGSIRWIRDRGKRVGSSPDLLSTFVGLAQDVTQLKNAEETLRTRGVELTHMARVSTIGQIASEVAHELNQPLTVIANFANGIRSRIADDSLTPQIGKAVDAIVVQCLRAKETVNRIRRFVQKDGLKRDSFAVSQVVANAAEMVLDQTRKHCVQVEFKSDGSDDVVVGDALAIENVIINLMINAIESMAEVVDRSRVLRIHLTNEKEQVIVAVHDTGIGIKTNLRARVFDSFFTTKKSGLGLGLAICKTTIEEHGGTIWIGKSRSGTCILFTLKKH
jgi:two-component system sensor kinase FixL